MEHVIKEMKCLNQIKKNSNGVKSTSLNQSKLQENMNVT